MVSYSQALRDEVAGDEPRVQISGDSRRRAISSVQMRGLDDLAELAAGPLSVEWNERNASPSSVGNLQFVRRRLSSREVWSAFYESAYPALARVWNLSDRDDLSLSGETAVGEDMAVLHGERRIAGVPVDGEFVEAFITTSGSRFGSGVLTRLNASIVAVDHAMPTIARDRWISQEQASRTADERRIAAEANHARPSLPGDRAGAALRFSCGAECLPYWLVSYRDGFAFRIDAITGAVLSERQELDELGPLLIQGRPPGSQTAQLVRFRGANVVNPSTNVSLGESSPVDGTHSFTQSTPVDIGFEGPVGAPNPNRFGRVERQQFVGGTWVAVPFRRAWTPSVGSGNFGSPDAWPQNSGTPGSLPHSTELLYGWTTYWQSLMRNTLNVEVVERLAIVLNPVSTESGVGCGRAGSGNFPSPTPDPNGSSTWGTLECSGGPNDDVTANFLNDGLSVFSTAHELGHTVLNCASQSGLGCENLDPTLTTPGAARGALVDWHPAVWGSHKEVVANTVGNILTRFIYNDSGRDGVGYVSDWNYASYDSPDDDFVTASQGAPTQLNCPSAVTCPSSPVPYHCVATTQNFYAPWNAGGLCARSCATNADCGRGLECMTVPLVTGGSAPACWYNTRHNRFWDTVGDRLAYTVGWRDALSLTLSAMGGQSFNFSRDLVLGPDSYYSRYLANATLRYEATRAVRSVYSGTGFVAGDDFPNIDTHATPIPVHSNAWTILDWGNGSASYPYFQDYADVDVVLFRGLAGSSYELQSWFMDRAGSPYVAISSIDNPGTYWESYGGVLATPQLPTTGWYAVVLWGAVGPARWQGRIRVVAGSDDYSNYSFAEAQPMADGFPVGATANWSGDSDMFQIYALYPGTGLQINVTGLPSGSVHVYTPTGGYYGGYSFYGSPATFTFPNLPVGNGHWSWTVVSSAVGSYPYTTSASLTCGIGGGCDTVAGPRETRNPWGDNFAGRLTDTAHEHVYSVPLEEAQGVSVSVSDTSAPCSVEISAFAPSVQTRFGVQPVLRWTDGAALSDPNGSAPGVGGYVEAITAGTYEFRVRPTSNSSCGFYRIHFAKSEARRGAVMPAW